MKSYEVRFVRSRADVLFVRARTKSVCLSRMVLLYVSYDLGSFPFIRSGRTERTGSCRCKWKAKVHSSRERACELPFFSCFQCKRIANYFALSSAIFGKKKTSANFASSRRRSVKSDWPYSKTGPLRPEPVLSVLRTDPFHLQTGRSDRPVLTNGKQP